LCEDCGYSEWTERKKLKDLEKEENKKIEYYRATAEMAMADLLKTQEELEKTKKELERLIIENKALKERNKK